LGSRGASCQLAGLQGKLAACPTFIEADMRIAGMVLIGLGLIGAAFAVFVLFVGSTVVGVVSLGVASILALVGYLMVRGAKPGVVSGAPAPGSLVGTYLADVPESRRLGTTDYEVFYQTPIAGKNGRASMLFVRIPAATPTTVHFTAEKWLDRLGKFLRIARETQTGDPAFDDAVYVRAPSEEYASQYLADPDKRVGVALLLKSGFGDIRLTGDTIEAAWNSFDPVKNDRDGLAEEAAGALRVLASRLPVVADDFRTPTDFSFIAYVALWVVTGFFAATAIALFLYPPIRGGDLFRAGLGAFAWEFLVLAVFAGALLRGTSVSHDRWFLLVGIGFFLIGLGSFGSLAAGNALLDTAPHEERVAPIINKRLSRSNRGGTTYYAIVQSWDKPGETVEFSVSSNDYNQIAPGRSRMLLAIGPGRFGVPWVKSQACQP